MANKTIDESTQLRKLIEQAVKQNILTVPGIQKFVAEKGMIVTGATINKILKHMGYVPTVSYKWQRQGDKS